MYIAFSFSPMGKFPPTQRWSLEDFPLKVLDVTAALWFRRFPLNYSRLDDAILNAAKRLIPLPYRFYGL